MRKLPNEQMRGTYDHPSVKALVLGIKEASNANRFMLDAVNTMFAAAPNIPQRDKTRREIAEQLQGFDLEYKGISNQLHLLLTAQGADRGHATELTEQLNEHITALQGVEQRKAAFLEPFILRQQDGPDRPGAEARNPHNEALKTMLSATLQEYGKRHSAIQQKIEAIQPVHPEELQTASSGQTYSRTGASSSRTSGLFPS